MQATRLNPALKLQTFAYSRPMGYRITDITALPDGRLLALHRRFNYLRGVSAKVGIIEPGQIEPGKLVFAAHHSNAGNTDAGR